jgi:hypothetical protein
MTLSDFARLALLILVLAPAPARADDAPAPKPIPPAEQASLEGFGAAAPLCLEWSDGCAVCARDAGKPANCSTPGIACQPGPIVCRSEKPK